MKKLLTFWTDVDAHDDDGTADDADDDENDTKEGKEIQNQNQTDTDRQTNRKGKELRRKAIDRKDVRKQTQT